MPGSQKFCIHCEVILEPTVTGVENWYATRSGLVCQNCYFTINLKQVRFVSDESMKGLEE